MKRVHVEPWTTKEKLCLASAVLHSGDQNWMSVSRILRMYGEPNRPLDWYSQKQCAVQYECLLSNAGTPKRKKRSEKGVETVDIPGEAIVRRLTKERIDELKLTLAEDKSDYLRIKKLQEDLDNGKLDDRLDELEIQMEEEIRKDKEKHSFKHLEAKKTEVDIPSRLGLLMGRNKFGDLGQDGSSSDSCMDVDVKPSLTPTSPLLTSLLQSPSPALLHRSSSGIPTISSLLHSTAGIPRVHDSPTLSKLLVSHSTQSSAVQSKVTEIALKEAIVLNNADSKVEEATIFTRHVDAPAPADVISGINKVNEKEDKLNAASLECIKKKTNVVRRLDLEVSPQDLEKEEQSSLNHTQDSDTLEEQLESEIELDSQAVDMIVMGPNQSAVIAVHHDTSNEHVEEESVVTSKDELPTDETAKGECCEITEETVVLMNEEEINKPVEDALKMINDATIIVAEPDQVVEVGTPVDQKHIPTTAVQEISDSYVKGIVAEEVILEEVVSEEMKDESIEEVTNKNDTAGINVGGEVKLHETIQHVVEQVVPEVEGHENESGITEVVAGILSDIEVKIATKDINEKLEDREAIKEKEENKNERIESEMHISIENRPKKVGRRRKSSKEVKEKETKAKDVASILSEKEPTAITTSVKELLPSILSTTEPESSFPPKKELATHLPAKDISYYFPTKGLITSVSEKESSPSVSELNVEEVKSVSSEKEPYLSAALNKTANLVSSTKEPVPSSSSVRETSLTLPPPENVISDFKVPRSDTPSTTDEDIEPVTYVARRGKPKRNTGFDSKPNSPSPLSSDEGSKEFRTWKKSILLVYNRLSTHKFASIFLRPITNERARGYHSVIHRPMDLSTLKKNIENGHIRTTVEFQRDVMLMFQNAIMYNNTNTEIFEMASVMQRECIQHFQLMVEAMGEGVPWRESAMNSEKSTRTRIKLEDIPHKRKRAHNSTSEDSKPAKRKKLVAT